jgi:hypothetical protein
VPESDGIRNAVVCTAPLLSFPAEVLFKVASYLSAVDACKLIHTCKHLAALETGAVTYTASVRGVRLLPALPLETPCEVLYCSERLPPRPKPKKRITWSPDLERPLLTAAGWDPETPRLLTSPDIVTQFLDADPEDCPMPNCIHCMIQVDSSSFGDEDWLQRLEWVFEDLPHVVDDLDAVAVTELPALAAQKGVPLNEFRPGQLEDPLVRGVILCCRCACSHRLVNRVRCFIASMDGRMWSVKSRRPG